MPPRITRKSYRPRASDRTMVDNVQPRSLSCFRIRKRRHENRMDLRRANNPEPLTMTWAGERSEHFCSFQSPGLSFLLTLPFIERTYRKLSHYRRALLVSAGGGGAIIPANGIRNRAR